jgi:DNA-binding CsgD family transcriptional regulator
MGKTGTLSDAVARLGGNFDGALDGVGIAAGVTDRNGIVLWQNRRAVELLGDCIGRPIAVQVAPESAGRQRQEFAKKVLGTAKTSDYELTIVDADGLKVPIEISSVALEGSDHQIVGVFGIMDPVAPPFTPPPISNRLTARQLEVLHLLCHGSGTTQIAERLGIEVETVRNHIRAVLRALGVHSRLEAVAAAHRLQLFAD